MPLQPCDLRQHLQFCAVGSLTTARRIQGLESSTVTIVPVLASSVLSWSSELGLGAFASSAKEEEARKS